MPATLRMSSRNALEDGALHVAQVAHGHVGLHAHAPAVVVPADGHLAHLRAGHIALEAPAQRLAERRYGEPRRAVGDGELDDLRRLTRRDLR